MKPNNFRLIEGIFLVLTILLSYILSNVPTSLISSTSSATLINIIYVSIILSLVFLVIYKLFSLFPGSNIIDIAEFLGGRFLKFIYTILFITYIICLSAIMIRLFAENISFIYYSHITTEAIVLIFIIATGFLCSFGLKTISRVNVILLPFLILSIIVIFFSSLPNFTIERALPILGYGIKETFIDGITNISAYGGIYVLFFILPFLPKTKNLKKIGLTSIIIHTVLLLLVVSSLLFTFPHIEDSSSTLPLYALSRQISLGDYLQSIDALFLMIWIPFFLVNLAINFHFALNSFGQLTKVKNSSALIPCFCAILFFICLLNFNYAELDVISSNYYKYSAIIFILIINIVILIFAAIKKLILKFKNKEISYGS